jgi:uncharacterized protein
MTSVVAGFDWDDGNLEKCRKHGVLREEIELALVDDAHIAPDSKHSVAEQRFIAVRRNDEGRPMFIAFTYRMRGGLRLIRPVSARYMHKKEPMAYEKSTVDDD